MSDPADLEEPITLRSVLSTVGEQVFFCGCWVLFLFLFVLCMVSVSTSLMR